MRKLFTTRSLALGAIIAALYAALTLLLPIISYGEWQCRLSEALTMLPVLFPEAVPGLTLGCLIANLMSPVGPLDIVFGTLATLIAAIGTRLLRKNLIAAAACPVLSNALIVGGMLAYVYHISFPLTALQVGLGELAAVLLGCLMLRFLWRNQELLKIAGVHPNEK